MLPDTSKTLDSLTFLREYINEARVEHGENPLRHNELIRKVKDEIGENLVYGNSVDLSNRPIRVAILNEDQMLLVGMRESKKVRLSVLKKLKSTEGSPKPQIPQTYAEALQLAADQARQLELAAPKVAFVDNLVDRTNLLTATQVAQKHGKSAIWLNKTLTELKVYNRAVKRGKVFQQWFVDRGYGEMKKSEMGYDQPLFTNAGEIWINEQLFSEGLL